MSTFVKMFATMVHHATKVRPKSVQFEKSVLNLDAADEAFSPEGASVPLVPGTRTSSLPMLGNMNVMRQYRSMLDIDGAPKLPMAKPLSYEELYPKPTEAMDFHRFTSRGALESQAPSAPSRISIINRRDWLSRFNMLICIVSQLQTVPLPFLLFPRGTPPLFLSRVARPLHLRRRNLNMLLSLTPWLQLLQLSVTTETLSAGSSLVMLALPTFLTSGTARVFARASTSMSWLLVRCPVL